MVLTKTSFRNRFHFSPVRGWMNDPNGLSYFQGRYHLFYQHHPHDVVWGPMHWGHAVSTDLLTWAPLPEALEPDRPYDRDGCFSGTAAVAGERHVLLYTGHVDDGRPGGRKEVQCLAWGNGVHYEKDPANPVIGPDQLPEGFDLADFRDPKLWKEGGVWYCLAAHRHSDGNGELLFFTSPDLVRWTYVGPALQSLGTLGEMWECPDFFCLDGKDVLLWSVMKAPRSRGSFQNLHSCVWAIGSLNRRTGHFQVESMGEVDQGLDFYAPQCLRTPDGRTVLLGWMHMWERTSPARDLGLDWAGCLTLPRELRIRDGRLYQTPARELAARRGEAVRFVGESGGGEPGPLRFAGVEGQSLDLDLVLEAEGRGACSLALYVGEAERTLVTWNLDEGMVVVDRSRSGHRQANLDPALGDCQVCEAVVGPGPRLELRLVLDRSALEVYVHGGLRVLSTTLFPQEESQGIEVSATGGRFRISGQAWPLN